MEQIKIDEFNYLMRTIIANDYGRGVLLFVKMNIYNLFEFKNKDFKKIVFALVDKEYKRVLVLDRFKLINNSRFSTNDIKEMKFDELLEEIQKLKLNDKLNSNLKTNKRKKNVVDKI